MLLRNYFNSFNFYTNDKLPRNEIDRRGFRVKKENETFSVVCSRPRQNLEFGRFTLLFFTGRQRNVPKLKTHVRSDCFCSLNLLFCCVVVAVAVVVENRELKQRRRQRQRKRQLKIYLYFICATSRLLQLPQLLQKWRTIQEPN